jgi:hypothetical protein
LEIWKDLLVLIFSAAVHCMSFWMLQTYVFLSNLYEHQVWFKFLNYEPMRRLKRNKHICLPVLQQKRSKLVKDVKRTSVSTIVITLNIMHPARRRVIIRVMVFKLAIFLSKYLDFVKLFHISKILCDSHLSSPLILLFLHDVCLYFSRLGKGRGHTMNRCHCHTKNMGYYHTLSRVHCSRKNGGTIEQGKGFTVRICLFMDCCLIELALYRFNLACWFRTKWTSSSFQQR